MRTRSIEAADIVIGTATTAAELLGQVKDWSTADAHKTALSVNTDVLNELGRVTAPDGREITKLVIDELKNKGEQERDTVLEHVKNYSRSVAKSATQVREKTLAARQKTREDLEVAKAVEIAEECATLKRRTYQVFGEKAPQRVLVDDTAEGGDYHFEETS